MSQPSDRDTNSLPTRRTRSDVPSPERSLRDQVAAGKLKGLRFKKQRIEQPKQASGSGSSSSGTQHPSAEASTSSAAPMRVDEPEQARGSQPSPAGVSASSEARMLVDEPEQARSTQPSSSRTRPSPGRVSTSSTASMLVDKPSSPSRSESPPTPELMHSVPRDYSRGDPLAEQRRLNWARGLAHTFTDEGTHCVTALNTTWIPRPVIGVVDILLRSDGRFGVEDPLHWPQLYCSNLRYLPFIPNCPADRNPFTVMWHCPLEDDFVRANDDPSGQAFGYLVSHKLAHLRDAIQTMDRQIAEYLR
ncbi:hypothetical protein PsYK624_171280 [Phanerochaete sordida]|uniref:Uncharacterized protein n=1 Tax=Phanerochaete sordida TaxID=48140 RepID=A0A9P3LMY2_9APHY|nr:hypothetical protein PsYK624_171280 [Phanerochaete sordida]